MDGISNISVNFTENYLNAHKLSLLIDMNCYWQVFHSISDINTSEMLHLANGKAYKLFDK